MKFIPLLLIAFFACNQTPVSITGSKTEEGKTLVKSEIGITDLLDTLIVDGFDFPIGNVDGKGSYKSELDGKTYGSWHISTKFTENYSLGIHPGIDLNGSGGGNKDKGQPVYSIAKGKIVDAKDYGAPWGGVVVILHKYLDNGHLYNCFSVYAHLENLNVKKGEIIRKRFKLGSIGTGGGSYPAHLHFEIRKESMANFTTDYWPSSNSKDVKWIKEYYTEPEQFIKTHRQTTCPYKEGQIIIAIKNQYRLYYYKNGELKNEYEIALSQSPVGHKQRQGDNKMPEGEYYICQKQKGPFYGNFAKFLGSRTIRISYPNSEDAKAGYAKKLITKNDMESIVSANQKKEIPLKNTKLGGGIVIHGWNGDWVADGK